MSAEWQVVKLQDIASVERGKFSARPRNDPKYYGGDIPFLQTGDVATVTGKVTTYTQTLNKEGLKVSRLFPAGTLLITIAANIGDTAEVAFDFACPDSLVAIRPHKGVNKNWLKFFLQTKKKYFESKATQNAQANINLQIIRPLAINLPPILEQKAIADLLSTWDLAIEKTERLIEVKAKRFKWLLAQLINKQNKTNGWKKVKLGELCQVTKGKQLNVAHMKVDGKYYALNGGIEPSGRTDDWNTEANTVTISEGGNSCGFVNFNQERFWSGGHCYSLLNLKETVSSEYLFFFLKLTEPRLMKLRVGSGLPNIQKKDVDKFVVDLPSLKEQKEIAKTLNIAQKEIKLLKKLAGKHKEQKRGLMQKLLTGQWRLTTGKEVK